MGGCYIGLALNIMCYYFGQLRTLHTYSNNTYKVKHNWLKVYISLLYVEFLFDEGNLTHGYD